MEGFVQWVLHWCADTTAEDCEDIDRFRRRERKHVKYREGDVFRFKISRRLYGCGRILLDYDRMRKKKEPFWDVLMTKPLVCSAYRIATERKYVATEELKNLNSLPSTVLTDHALFYGDFGIVGNIPAGDREDYPIMYGSSIDIRERAVVLQCGKLYRRIGNGDALFKGFTNNGVSYHMNVKLPVLLQCIRDGSNTPFREQTHWAPVHHDLRNPRFRLNLI